MRLYKYILSIAVLSISCERDNIGPLLNEDNIIFFMTDKIEAKENDTDTIVVEVGAIGDGALSSQVTLGGTATEGVDYTVIGDLNLDFPAGVYRDDIKISLIDNNNFDDDHTIILSLPSGQGYSENNRREFIISVVNNEVSSGTVTSAISSGADDAEEGITGNSPGNIDLGSSDLEFGEREGSTRGSELIGLRFNGISIPKAATIVSARIQFTVDEDVDDPAEVVMTISGEAVDNSAAFNSTDFNISGRTLTTANVDWNIPVWATVGEAGANQRTADIKTVIQEIVDRSGWVYDNSLNIIFTPTAATRANPSESGRVAETFEGDPTAVPVLTIEWKL